MWEHHCGWGRPGQVVPGCVRRQLAQGAQQANSSTTQALLQAWLQAPALPSLHAWCSSEQKFAIAPPGGWAEVWPAMAQTEDPEPQGWNSSPEHLRSWGTPGKVLMCSVPPFPHL